MLHVAFVTLLLVLSVPGDGKELEKLTEIYPSDGDTVVNLTVGAAEISVPLHGYDDDVTFTYRGRFFKYRGVASLPGPVIHVKPGGRLLLDVFNDLGPEVYTEGPEMMYSYHGVNTTNVHFHGLHSDPNIDDVFKTAASGQSLLYNLPIPKEHLPGLHWYHTHAHGSSYPLLMGGLFGPLVVDEGEKHPLASLPSHIMMIHVYRLGKSTLCDGSTMSEVDLTIGNNMSSMPRIRNKRGKELEMPSDLFLVNGQHKPTVRVSREMPTLLRLTFAAGSCHLNISLPDQCSFHIAAMDGVPIKRTRMVEKNWLYFTTATRYDLVVVCKKGTSKEFPVRLMETHEALFYITVDEARKKYRHKLVFPLQIPLHQPEYLRMNNPTIKRDISFSQLDVPLPKPYYVIGQGTDCSSLVNSSTCYYEHFMGQNGGNRERYHGFAVPLGGVIEGRIFGDSQDVNPHPLHLHVNHFEYVDFVPRKGGQHENTSMLDYGLTPGDIRDTIPILDGVTVIRWRAASYAGEVVYHCHMLTHEDRGMMVSYLVYGGAVEAATENAMHTMPSVMNAATGDRHIFLALAVVFFICAVLSVVASWMRVNPTNLGHLSRGRDAFAAATFRRMDSASEMERTPLVG
ncbi:hypothetical protein DQ04_00321040 [Trypanosoma grayi]|uniref:hypothetical protein n=1 Tax=Trypanosoma grayi TaxID=71804 RepID=UPI0004F42C6E|nr:hypothetical protein DQ04_00321040 [Trypanosoma grayi]KEG14735.1 hypothetical protein DQ04_00321040 [Trypanosoma grayi]